METFFTPTAILLATIGAFIIGALWYSPFLFMKAWLKGEGITKEHLPKRSLAYMVRINAYSFIAHACIATVLALIFDLIQVESLKIAISVAALLTLGLIVSSRFIDMLYTTQGTHYDLKSQIKFLVASGYYLAVSVVISSILFCVAR